MITDLPFLKSKGTIADSVYKPQPFVIRVMLLVIFIVFAVFLARLVELQLIKGNYYLSVAEDNRIREFPIFAERGVVYDRNGEVLVRNIPAFSVQMNTGLCTDCQEEVRRLGKLIDISNSEIDLSKNLIILSSGLTRDQVLPIETNLYNFKSISILVTPVREYVYGDAFAHALGYVGLDDSSVSPKIVGKVGIEQYYDKYLAGVDGAKVVEINSTGESANEIYFKEAFTGRDVYSTLDAGFQAKALNLLKDEVNDNDTTAGVVVAQDPTTGAVLALVNYPSFDPNKLVLGISQDDLEEINTSGSFPFYNRAISAVYPPGSVFKMVVASAVLTENVIDKTTTVFDPGFLQVGTYIFRNWKLDGHGDVDMLTALQKSNDTYFYTVGSSLGIQKLHDWAVKFGFGHITGIDLTDEADGVFPDGKSRDWYLGDTIISSIGQGDILATPLQVNNMVSYFANGGYLYKPHLLDHIEGIDLEAELPLAENLLPQEHYATVREGMNKAVNLGGTAYPFFDFEAKHNIKVYGKTGTSEFTTPQGEPATHAWFSVFIDERKPIVLTVFLEGGGGGSDDAAPIARQLVDFWLSN